MLGLEDAEVALAEDVGLELDKLLERFPGQPWVGAGKIVWPMDVLTEEDPLPTYVEITGQASGGMPRDILPEAWSAILT